MPAAFERDRFDLWPGILGEFEQRALTLPLAKLSLDPGGVELVHAHNVHDESTPPVSGLEIRHRWAGNFLARIANREFRPIRSPMIRRRLPARPWNESFLEELCLFPGAPHDDQVDALSGAFA